MNSSKQKPAQEHAMTVASGVIGNLAVPAWAFFANKAPSVAAGFILAATVTQLAIAGCEWHADRHRRLIESLLTGNGKSDFEWATAMHEAVATPEGRGALFEILAVTRSAVSASAIPCVAALLKEYTVGGVRKPDAFFHAVCEVVTRASDDDMRVLREVFVKADGVVVVGDVVSFGIAKASEPNEIQVMVSGVPAPPPIPGLRAGPTVSVRDADYIAQRLIVSGLAKSVVLNASNRKDKMFEQSGFCIPRADCQRLARLLTAA